jgi:hypothetical protein
MRLVVQIPILPLMNAAASLQVNIVGVVWTIQWVSAAFGHHLSNPRKAAVKPRQKNAVPFQVVLEVVAVIATPIIFLLIMIPAVAHKLAEEVHVVLGQNRQLPKTPVRLHSSVHALVQEVVAVAVMTVAPILFLLLKATVVAQVGKLTMAWKEERAHGVPGQSRQLQKTPARLHVSVHALLWKMVEVAVMTVGLILFLLVKTTVAALKVAEGAHGA